MRSRLQGCPHPAEEDEEKPSSHPTPRETLRGSPIAGPGPDTATPRGRGARGTHMGYPRCPRVHPCFCSCCARPGLCTWGLLQSCARLRFLVHARACARMHGHVRAPVPCTHTQTSPSVRVAEEAAAAPGELLPTALLLLQLRGRVLPKAPPPPRDAGAGSRARSLALISARIGSPSGQGLVWFRLGAARRLQPPRGDLPIPVPVPIPQPGPPRAAAAHTGGRSGGGGPRASRAGAAGSPRGVPVSPCPPAPQPCPGGRRCPPPQPPPAPPPSPWAPPARRRADSARGFMNG